MHHFLSKPKQSVGLNFAMSVLNRILKPAMFFILAYAMIHLNPLQAVANQHVVGIEQNDTTVKLRINDVLQIELPGNAGTGFKWHFNKLDETFFMLLGSHKKMFKKDNPRHVGNAYIESLSFKALKVGSNDIRLLYYRPWEGEEMAEKSLHIKVSIEP
jgi:predicted secreted protein